MSCPSASSHAERVVLGLGGTVDVELEWDGVRLGEVAEELGIKVQDLDPNLAVTDLRSLVAVILSHFKAGTGGEHFAHDPLVLHALARRFSSTTTLGGTNIRAALAMAVLGIPATVHMVKIDDTVVRLVPEGTVLLHSGTVSELDPHLIVQFPRGAEVRLGAHTIVAPQANRVIVTNDPPNRELTLSPQLGPAAGAAEVLVLSTLNAIQEAEILTDRLNEVGRLVTALHGRTLVFWEEAAYHLPSVQTQVKDVMVDLVDVYSMNEDEMSHFIGRRVNLLDCDDLAQALDELVRVVPAPTVVVHSRLWALAKGERADELRTALRGGITMATTRYVHGDMMTRADHDIVASLAPDDEALLLASRLESLAADVVCEAGHVLESPNPTTIGLGDSFVGGFVAALLVESTHKGVA